MREPCCDPRTSPSTYKERGPAGRNWRPSPKKQYRDIVKLKQDKIRRPPAGADPADPKKRKASSVETLLGDEPPMAEAAEELPAAKALPEEPEWREEVPPSPLEEDLSPTDNGDESPLVSTPPDHEDSPPGPRVVPDRVPDEVVRLRAEVESLRNEKHKLVDRLQRVQAEFENIRKRLTREKSEARQYAAMETIESLLPIVDDFERALNTPGIDPQLHQGLEMIGKRIFDVFERAGLKQIDIGDGKFNPHLHHAVDKASAENDKQDQTILEVYQRGYLFIDRLLRAALVKVAVKD